MDVQIKVKSYLSTPHTHPPHTPSLTVLPNVTVWPEQQEVSIHDMGRRVTFVCQAFGIPTPQVSQHTSSCSIFVSIRPKCNNCTLVTMSPSPLPPPPPTHTHKVTWVSDVGGLLNGHCEGPSLSEVFGEASLDYSDFPFTRGRTPW